MKKSLRISCVLAVSFSCSATEPVSPSRETASETRQESATSRASNKFASRNDETNESPRERGRVLVKRNPIASEYQVFGDIGASSGADNDGEGVDYRAFFPSPKRGPITDSLSLGFSVNYNSLSAVGKPGAEARFNKSLGLKGDWSIAGQIRSAASERQIEHYEALWQKSEIVDGGEPTYILDKPRYSNDLIVTRNDTASIQIDHRLNEQHSIYFKSYYQDYFDNFYRNRTEYQIGNGELQTDTLSIDPDGNITAASVTNARTRRYFGDTDNWRTRQHNMLGGVYTGADSSVEYSVYSHRWNLDTTWYNWNFNDYGLDLSYDTRDPYVPTVTVDNDIDLLDLSNTRFTSLRVHDTTTRDRDRAGRIDGEKRIRFGDSDLWLQTGLLHREKRRERGEEREVYTVDTTSPFFLSDVASQQVPESIINGRVPLAPGLDASLGRFRLASRPDQFLHNKQLSQMESAPESYDAEEAVSAAYLLGTMDAMEWRWTIGGRIEYTRTDTRGTVVIPESVDDATEGVLRGEFIDPSTGARSVMKDLYASNDYTNALPSIEVKREVGDSSNVRASWSTLLMRPQYINIVDYRRISVPTQSISEGNPDLMPTNIDRFRLAWTTRSALLGDLALEAYLIDITQFFYSSVSIESLREEGELVPYRVSRVENGERGRIRGLELQWTKTYENVPIFEEGSFRFAYTYSDSDATVGSRPGERLPVPERSKHLLRATARGSIGRLSTEVEFGYQSEALDDVGETAAQDDYRQAVFSSRLAFSYTVDDKTSLTLNLANLPDHPERSYEGSPARVTRNQYSSWYGTLGMQRRF